MAAHPNLFKRIVVKRNLSGAQKALATLLVNPLVDRTFVLGP